MRYDLLSVAAETRDALSAAIDRDLAELPEDATDHDRESVWLQSAFWPILARVLRDHGVDDETGEDLRWMHAALIRLEGSQGWDRGFDAARSLEARRRR